MHLKIGKLQTKHAIDTSELVIFQKNKLDTALPQIFCFTDICNSFNQSFFSQYKVLIWKVSTAPWEPFCQWILWQKRVNIFFAAENLDCRPVTPGQWCQPLCRRSPGSKTDSSAPKFSWWYLCPFSKVTQIQVFYPTCNPCNISSMANLLPKINRTCLLWNPNAHSCVLLFTKIWLNLIWFDLLCCTVQYGAYSFLQRKTRLSIFMNNIYWI